MRKSWLITRSQIATMLLLALVVLLGSSSSASAARTPDPVLASINTALAKQQISPTKARSMRIDWIVSGRAARVARTTSRRNNVLAVRAYAIRLARAGGLSGPRLEPVLLSVKATTYVMIRSTSYPSHEQELTIPGEPLVFTYYSGRGVQLQPFETLKQGMREVNKTVPDVEAARAIGDRLRGLGVPRGRSIVWEYHFAFGGPARPWTSAISQALATEFYYRLAELVPAEERAVYDAVAAAAAESFLRSTRAGGVFVSEGAGRFYVMYPFSPAQRILNGHLQALLNVNRYANASKSRRARTIVTLGLRAVVPMLPRFDTGAWSNYQPSQEAELGYHEFQTEQLTKLGAELANATLAEYATRWTGYLTTPPTISISATSWPAIRPAPDGFRDTIDVQFTLDKRSTVTMVIFDPRGNEVNRISTTSGRGDGSISWNGRASSGRTAFDGAYDARLTITDVAGNRTTGALASKLTVARDRIPPTLRVLTLRSVPVRSTLVLANAFDGGGAWVSAEVRVGGRLLATRRGGRAGTIVLRIGRPVDQVRRGVLILRDAAGNQREVPLAG